MKKNLRNDIIISLITATLITLIAWSGILRYPDRWLQDFLFQTPTSDIVSDDIVIIGIDDKALKELGPYDSWDRSIMASALNVLSSDPAYRPSVVAIDIPYEEETDPASDKALVDAARKLTTVTANRVSYGSKIQGDIDRSITEFKEPYEGLKEYTIQGHTNATVDTDGVMRHSLLYVEPGNNVRAYSFAFETASMYLKKQGHMPTYPSTDSKGQFYVPYYGRSGDYYDNVSIIDLINGEVPPEYYAGKIVLIGPYATGLQYAFYTPIDRTLQTYGVEIQANFVQCFLEGNYKTEISDVPLLICTFLMSALMCFLYLKSKFPIAAILAVVLVLASLELSILIYDKGFVTHPLWSLNQYIPTFITAVSVKSYRTSAERKSVVNTFQRYVAPNVVGEILKEGAGQLALGGKLTDIAVLFVDIRGFTSMSENMEPQEVVTILNRYLSMASDCITANEGTLDKFIGDAAMAFWGAPVPQEDSVYLAAKAAVAIVEGSKKISEDLKNELNMDLNVGVGIHYGPAVVGNMGSVHRMDYTAIGDTVNTASRLESNAPKGTIYISRAVADKLEGRATFTSLGDSVKLKGKSEGFEVLTLDSLKEAQDA
ncbi:MAG: adenylate/guanylate cyclase domain-containing protein [Clostridia bacterium]|nr:adenylate/guanylate cyclase domain-containing protein [Clostridia bacterium]